MPKARQGGLLGATLAEAYTLNQNYNHTICIFIDILPINPQFIPGFIPGFVLCIPGRSFLLSSLVQPRIPLDTSPYRQPDVLTLAFHDLCELALMLQQQLKVGT